jgi:hypothetical protein
MKIRFYIRDNQSWQASYKHSSINVSKGEYEIDNHVFETTLKYQNYSHGRSTTHVHWLDIKENRIYTSSMNLLHEFILDNKFINGTITGKFTWKQQGTAILLKQV